MPILFLSLLGYIFYDFYHYRYVSFSPTAALTTSSFVVQFGVLAYLFLGVWLVRLEEKNSMEELTLTMDNAYISQVLAKILFGVFTIVFIVLFTFITYLFMFYDESLNSPTYFVSVLLYIILFWGFSFLVSLLIGMIEQLD
jgi:ABC-type transport system involved in multi-copper enzyme maturation permease subunit